MDGTKRTLIEDSEESSLVSEASGLSDSEIFSAAEAFIADEQRVQNGGGIGALRELVVQELGAEKIAELVAETGLDEEAVLATFLTALLRRGRERLKRPDVNTLDDVVSLIRNSRNIVVLCGAGISTSMGIPDFRSEGGIYERVRSLYPFLDDPQMLFDLDQFFVDPRPFYEFASEIFPKEEVLQKTSFCHRFIAQLERSGRLLRCYTQNIDGLERAAGITRTVFCHGSFETLRCIRCGHKRTIQNTDRQQIRSGEVIYCELCSSGRGTCSPAHCSISPSARSTSIGESSDEDDIEPGPVMKPGIVFFGEPLPQEFFDCIENDMRQADMLLVIGTSLQVAPVADIPRNLDPRVPQILVNRELVARSRIHFDVELLGDCDYIIRLLAELLNWTEEIGTIERSALCKQVDQCFTPPNRYVFQGARIEHKESEICSEKEPYPIRQQPHGITVEGKCAVDECSCSNGLKDIDEETVARSLSPQ